MSYTCYNCRKEFPDVPKGHSNGKYYCESCIHFMPSAPSSTEYKEYGTDGLPAMTITTIKSGEVTKLGAAPSLDKKEYTYLIKNTRKEEVGDFLVDEFIDDENYVFDPYIPEFTVRINVTVAEVFKFLIYISLFLSGLIAVVIMLSNIHIYVSDVPITEQFYALPLTMYDILGCISISMIITSLFMFMAVRTNTPETLEWLTIYDFMGDTKIVLQTYNEAGNRNITREKLLLFQGSLKSKYKNVVEV